MAEELGTEYNSFIQPILEFRSGFDHVIRAESKKYRTNTQLPEDDAKYVKQNLEKALGHVYRAFFDTADWLSTELRSKYHETISKYSPDTISKAFPEYYTSHKAQFAEISIRISDCRRDKDVSNDDSILSEVTDYSEMLDKIINFYRALLDRLPALEEIYEKENKKSKRKTIVTIISLLLGLAGLVFGLIQLL